MMQIYQTLCMRCVNLHKKRLKDDWKPSCVSKKPIQFHPPLHIQEVLHGSFYESLCREDYGSLIVVPCSSGVVSLVAIAALSTMLGVRHLPPKGHSFLS